MTEPAAIMTSPAVIPFLYPVYSRNHPEGTDIKKYAM